MATTFTTQPASRSGAAPSEAPGFLLFDYMEALRADADGVASDEQQGLLADPELSAAHTNLKERVAPVIDRAKRHLARNPEIVDWARISRSRAIHMVTKLGGDPRRAADAWQSSQGASQAGAASRPREHCAAPARRGSRAASSSSDDPGLAEGDPDPPSERSCECGCGADLAGRRPQTLYASEACRKRTGRAELKPPPARLKDRLASMGQDEALVAWRQLGAPERAELVDLLDLPRSEEMLLAIVAPIGAPV
jgi:hypothetical protein